MHCTTCGWPLAETSVVSAHRTSEGLVCYRRCVCGRITIRLRPPSRAAATGAAATSAPVLAEVLAASGGQRLAG
jgi:hypothetical protein